MTDHDTDPESQMTGFFPSRYGHDRAEHEWVNPRDVLDRLRMLPVHAWREPSGEAGGIHHLGPTAEDFYEVFEVGPDPENVPASGANGVAVAAIQGLADRLDEQDERLDRHVRNARRQREIIQEQRADIETLREQLESLRAELSRLRLDADEGG